MPPVCVVSTVPAKINNGTKRATISRHQMAARAVIADNRIAGAGGRDKGLISAAGTEQPHPASESASSHGHDGAASCLQIFICLVSIYSLSRG